MSFRVPFVLASRFLGLLLLVAAGLKLNGLAVEPGGRMGLFTAPAFQVGVVEFEIFLAIWLLSGKQPLGAWTTAFAIFVVFAGVSAYQGWIGQASCGCFGRLSINPWYTFGIDLAVLLALFLARPELEPLRKQPGLIFGAMLPAFLGLFGATAVLGALSGGASLLFGSADVALARLRGERISLYPRLVDVGTGASGETREAAVEVVNRMPHPIRLIGGTQD